MAFTATLVTEEQVLLAIGGGASAAQILDTNTTIWAAYAESDMEKAIGDNKGIVANYSSIPAPLKQSLAAVCAMRASWYAIQQNQNTWGLATSQSKLNVALVAWKDWIKDVEPKDQEVVDDMGL